MFVKIFCSWRCKKSRLRQFRVDNESGNNTPIFRLLQKMCIWHISIHNGESFFFENVCDYCYLQNIFSILTFVRKKTCTLNLQDISRWFSNSEKKNIVNNVHHNNDKPTYISVSFDVSTVSNSSLHNIQAIKIIECLTHEFLILLTIFKHNYY